MYVKPVHFPLPFSKPYIITVHLLTGEGWPQGAYFSRLTLPGDLVSRSTASHSPTPLGLVIWHLKQAEKLVGLKGARWSLKAWLLVIAVSLLCK